ncbi:protein TBATA isoform X3 [Ictidomys tridecemlineatus]
MRSPKATPSGTYRFGRLSHHSFFSRHHPHPHHVTHIPDFTGRPVCIVRNKLSASPLPRSSILSQCLKVIPSISVPIGDPQSNRNPQLSYEAWKKELKELTSRVVMFTKETEQNNKEILELLCQILQTDSLSAVQYWLLYATPTEKDLALALLQRAVSQLLPQPSASPPAERLWNQPQQIQEAPQEKPHSPSSQLLKAMRTSRGLRTGNPDHVGKAQVLRVYS